MAGPVEAAVRKSVAAGTILLTSSQRKPFVVESLDERGVVLLLGKNRTPSLLEWRCLEGVPAYLNTTAPWVDIGGQYKVEGNPGTLDEYLKRCINRATAGWVAVLLAQSGVVEIAGGRPTRVRVARPYAASHGQEL